MLFSQSTIIDSFFYRRNKHWNVCQEHVSEEISLTMADGVKIVCLHIHAAPNTKNAAVFLLHGRGGNASRYSHYVKPIIREGFDVFIVDWRGYGKSQGRPNHQNVIDDSIRAMEYFLALEETKFQKKILWGLSLGGQVAIRLARKYPGYFDALVTEGAISSFRQAVSDHKMILKNPIRFLVQEPYAASQDIREINGLPKLIIHSVEDRQISFKNAEILFRHAHGPKTLLKLTGNHLYGLNRQNAPNYIREFLKISQTGC